MRNIFASSSERHAETILRQLQSLRDEDKLAVSYPKDRKSNDLSHMVEVWRQCIPLLPKSVVDRLSYNMPEGTKLWLSSYEGCLQHLHISLCTFENYALPGCRKVDASEPNVYGRILRLNRNFNFEDKAMEGWGARIFDSSQRGMGMATQGLVNFIDLGIQLGMRKMTIKADEIGAYCWAKYGFLPMPESCGNLRDKLRLRLQACESALPQNVYSQAIRLLQLDDPKMLWKIADLDYDLNGTRLGKRLLLPDFERFFPDYERIFLRSNRNLEWRGELKFANADQMARFHAYLQSRNAPSGALNTPTLIPLFA